LSLNTLGPERTRLYCEAAGLIGDGEFLAPLARWAAKRPEAVRAIAQIGVRERITPRSKALRNLEEPLRVIVARALAGPGPDAS
jgi:HEAT repeat protein